MVRRGEKIGQGGEKVVYNDADNPERVVSVYKEGNIETARQIKGTYYFQKIIHLLFPDNFPDIHSASANGEGVLVSDRVKIDEGHQVMARVADYTWDNGTSAQLGEEMLSRFSEAVAMVNNDPEYSALRKAVSDAGIYLDMSPFNIAHDPDGNLMNLDVNSSWNIYGWEVERSYDEKVLLQSIEAIPDERGRRMATSYFERMEKLFKEEKEILEKKKQKKSN